MNDNLPEEYKPIRELYYTGSAKGKSYVEKMTIKTAIYVESRVGLSPDEM
ncbi:protein of unknown function [Xenorhabdus bovienii]|uniref:Uncharacterized protein n=1 Tax=Xenorhabdus bovienii TaxID=40576 RepID=A0A0B6X2U0_XENBV|nr:protein of unknown function [Xenorhabdus bovienii]